MKEPIKAGDHCIVIGGYGQHKSPNLGKKVVVTGNVLGAHGMTHAQFGRIVRCAGEGVMQLADGGGYIQTDWADFAVIWLEKIPPVKTGNGVTTENGMLV